MYVDSQSVFWQCNHNQNEYDAYVGLHEKYPQVRLVRLDSTVWYFREENDIAVLFLLVEQQY